MTQTPIYLQDAKKLLTAAGFATNDVWYHGTSSALVASIQEQGLNRSGDKALNQAAVNTMKTIGNDYAETTEPVYLTQSKELAYYWASKTVRDRSVRFEGEEQPVVLAVNLPESELAKVKPDVGAASLLLIKDGEQFMAHLASIYQNNGFDAPEIDLMKANRLDYLNLLGMAYLNQDVSAEYIEVAV
jgi:hypothetical protein